MIQKKIVTSAILFKVDFEVEVTFGSNNKTRYIPLGSKTPLTLHPLLRIAMRLPFGKVRSFLSHLCIEVIVSLET